MKKILTILLFLCISLSGMCEVNEHTKIARNISVELKNKKHFKILADTNNDEQAMYLLLCPETFMGNSGTIVEIYHDVMSNEKYEHLYDNILDRYDVISKWLYDNKCNKYIITHKYESSYNILIISVLKVK